MLRIATIALMGMFLWSCSQAAPTTLPEERTRDGEEVERMNEPTPVEQTSRTATFGAGCFWCVEAVLEQVDGVTSAVKSGYMGGDGREPDATRPVCTGATGHAEVVQVTFNPATMLSYDALLEWFWKLHDPTTLNRQGGDRGTQYRSAIFYHDDAQRDAATASKAKAGRVRRLRGSDRHRDHTRLDVLRGRSRAPGLLPTEQGTRTRYCPAVIAPKLEKLGLKK